MADEAAGDKEVWRRAVDGKVNPDSVSFGMTGYSHVDMLGVRKKSVDFELK